MLAVLFSFGVIMGTEAGVIADSTETKLQGMAHCA